MSTNVYHYRYCRAGHMIYGFSAIDAKRCRICGEEFVPACSKCGEQLQSVFHSPTYLRSAEPVSPPSRPDHCDSCGTAYPWVGSDAASEPLALWTLLHPAIVGVARQRFESGHYADAVEAALKHVNATVKALVLRMTGKELDGADLMHTAFSPNKPVVVLDDLSTQTGKSIQLGYMEIFAGSMSGIRNPKAHDNIQIDQTRCIHHLFVASLLAFKLDERP
jgi:uncharacterized protein (TIGR02391 family)